MVKLRHDNTEDNCTVDSDPEPKTGRPHYWTWVSMSSNYRVCTTCGREQLNIGPKLNGHEPTRGTVE